MDLFSAPKNQNLQPLSEKLRPTTLDEVVGQSPIDKNSKLGKMLRAGMVPSMILWGPPGTGKTSFALALAQTAGIFFESISAIDAGAKVLREVGEASRDRRLQVGQKTILFVDEIHRFNKAQQDVLLPFVERGDLILIGATTENPSYELNKALLSRTRVVVFERLSRESLLGLIQKAEKYLQVELGSFASTDVKSFLLDYADGDGRRLINACELLFNYHQVHPQEKINLEGVREILQTGMRSYDKNSEMHYDVISAFIKSVRGSDPDAAVYYLARMLDGGEDPVFVARRLIILASEDVGNAEPRGLTLAMSALQAVEAVGMPEASIVLSQVTTFLACCPKSNAAYSAIKAAQKFVGETGSLPIPLHLRSSSTQMAKDLGYGKDYQYPHNHARGWVEQVYLPKEIAGKKFYEPVERGFEKNLSEYLKWLRRG
ncbi:MAG: replication-associated recombination protein A [Bdellovibrionia bacterium]